MSGFLVGQLILWLIIALIVIVVAVYVVNWLYHRSSKEVSFVRTGFLGERVVINGGAFVLPFIHEYTPVNMNVLPMPITRSKQDAVISRDRMRIDIEADFYVRVQPTREAVSIAAATLGRRTLEPEKLHTLLSGKFVSAMRSVASEMTMEDMHEKRGDYVARVKAAAAEALAQNGLELESVAITDLDQTDLEYFNPSNRFDAEGLTQLMQDIEAKRKLRNDIERERETARREQERDIEVRRALQRTEVARERALRETEAEQAQISARETIEKARIANEQAIAEARIASERETRQREIERTQAVEAREIGAREEIEKARIANQRAVDTARIASEREVRQSEIERTRTVEQAEIQARESIEKARIQQDRVITDAGRALLG